MWRRRQCDLWKLDRHRLIGHRQARQQRLSASTSAARTIRSAAWRPGDANVIAFNTKAGIGLEQLNTDTGNTLSANSIYSNQTLGIDLGDSGVPLTNKSGGSQVGPNHLLNYPVLTSASASSVSTTITGSLTVRPTRHSRSSSSATRPLILQVTARVKPTLVSRP